MKMNENEFLFRTIFHRNSRFIFSDSFNLHTFHLYHKVLAYGFEFFSTIKKTLRLVNCLCNITLGESFSNQNAKEN